MPALETLQVFQALNRSPNARLEHSAELGDGLAAALWSNHHDAQDYEAPSHHTLSCYIAGGTGTFRRDQPGTKGGPDKLCILPAEHQSGWVINGDIRLAHLYFSPEQFALGCVTLLDREPREMQLREQTFLDDPQQARRFRQLISLELGRTRRTPADQQPGPRNAQPCPAQPGRRRVRVCASRADWRRISGGSWWSSSTASWPSPSAWGNWQGCVRCRNTTLRGCFAKASACRRISMCWHGA